VAPTNWRFEMTKTITTLDHSLFIKLAMDAGNWSGTPLLDITASERGNLTNLKKAGLLTTFREEGCDWVSFTELGREYAAANHIEI